MKGERPNTTSREKPVERFVEGEDYYFEAGLMVLTERFLKRRGLCCDNRCRHCPYRDENEAAYSK